MDSATIDRQQHARELFFNGSARLVDLTPQGVDPAILRGWQRCRDYGMTPDRTVVFRAVQQSRVRASRESSHLLRTVAAQELNQLGRALAASGSTVILTDPQLMILDVLGRSDRMSREIRSLAREGVDLSERIIGSNALSLAAVERAPAIVLNNGHFFNANSVFACAAAPLLSPTGQLLGILDVTTCRDALPAEAPFLVSAAAKAIENAMFWQEASHLLIRFHPRDDFVDTALGAIIACTVDGEIVGANQIALSMLALAWPLDGARFERSFRQKMADLLAQAGRLDRFALDLTTQAGAAVFARVRMPERAQTVLVRRHDGTLREAGIVAGAVAALASASPSTSITHGVAGPRAMPSLARRALPGEMSSHDWPPVSWVPAVVRRRALPACLAGVPVLLVGESGVGKSLASSWLARMSAPDSSARSGPVTRSATRRLLDPTSPAASTSIDASDAEPSTAPLRWRVVHDEDAKLLPWLAYEQALHEGRCLIIEDVDQLPVTLRRTLIDWLDRVLPALAACDAGRGEARARLIATASSLGGLAQVPGLLHRIGGLTVELPPLRRRDDRLALIDDGLCVASLRDAQAGNAAPVLDAMARERLSQYGWPGNLHELGWVCRYLAAIATCGNVVTVDDLPPQVQCSTAGPDVMTVAVDGSGEASPATTGANLNLTRARSAPERTMSSTASESGGTAADLAEPAGGDAIDQPARLRELEQRAIELTLTKHHGNLSSAARELGVSRGTLYRRIRSAS